MSGNGIFRGWLGTLVIAVSLACALTSVSAEGTSSSISDRERIVSIARNLTQNPLDLELQADRAWAMRWLIDAPDITVTICAAPLNHAALSDYPHARDILAQYALSMAANIIENPASENDKVAQQMAGVEGALDAYRSILRDKPKARSPELDDLITTQSRGELSGFVQTAYAQCLAEGSKKYSGNGSPDLIRDPWQPSPSGPRIKPGVTRRVAAPSPKSSTPR